MLASTNKTMEGKPKQWRALWYTQQHHHFETIGICSSPQQSRRNGSQNSFYQFSILIDGQSGWNEVAVFDPHFTENEAYCVEHYGQKSIERGTRSFFSQGDLRNGS